MEKSALSRKDFIRNATLGLAGINYIPDMLAMQSTNFVKKMKTSENNPSLILKNVRLETGFEYADGEVIATKTGLFCVEIENGKIAKIRANDSGENAIDAKGMLMLPGFRDMHIHLDKTFYGDRWQAARRRTGGVKGMIALEQEILPAMLKNSVYKAEKLIELLQAKGTSFARSHVNIEPTSKLDSLRNLQTALEHKRDVFGAELVAFPQHGVFYTETAPYLKEAAQSGIDFIGGLDPYTIDGAIEKTLDFTVQLALDHNKGIEHPPARVG